MPLASAPQHQYQKPPVGAVLDRGNRYTRNLIVACPMNEVGSRKIYDYASGLSGTLGSAVKWKGGPYGPCLDFPADGTNGLVTWPVSPQQQVKGGSWTAIYAMNVRSGAFAGIWHGLPSDNSPGHDFGSSVNGSTGIALQAGDNNYTGYAGLFTQGKWVRMGTPGYLYAASTHYVLADFVNTGTSFNGGGDASATQLYFGTGRDGAFDGQMAYFYLWNTLLTTSDLQALTSDPHQVWLPTQPERRFWFLGVPASGFIAPLPIVKSQAVQRAATW